MDAGRANVAPADAIDPGLPPSSALLIDDREHLRAQPSFTVLVRQQATEPETVRRMVARVMVR